jgi:hypothetical protein
MPSYAVSDPPDQRTRPPMARADVYTALLAADDGYLEAAQASLRAGDDAAARHALEVLAAIVAVALSQLHAPSENRVLQ